LAVATSTRRIAFVISSVESIVYRSKTDRVLWPLIAIAVFSGTPARTKLRITNADREQSALSMCAT